MKKPLLTLLTALMLNAAWAEPLADAIAAYDRVRPLALRGDASAQKWLADAYLNGEGVVRDYAEAVKWYRLAAQQGNVNAQVDLGVIFNIGEFARQDYAEAVKWYRLAAQQGNVNAQALLGMMYENGRGVVQDYVKAHSWFNLGAIKGNPISIHNRDIVAKRMTSQQIAEAQKLARDCQARNFKGCD